MALHATLVLPHELRVGGIQFAAVLDDYLLARRATRAANSLDCLHDIHALDHLAEDDVLAIEPGRLCRAQKELRAVGAWACIGHREDARTRVLQLEVFVGKLLAVNRLAAGAVMVGEITTLAHEVGDYAVERALLVALALVPQAQLPKVFGRLRHSILAQLHHNPSDGLAVQGHVKVHLRVTAQLQRLVHRASWPVNLVLHPLLQLLHCLVVRLHLATGLEVSHLLGLPLID
mmetsp:Transcript_33279/g.87574  ORF Transcript_33279/g.87574 Transcript_33279/m.87574 type:complete len:232 (+) Transcript_33279:470-1165(+)